MVKHKRQAFLKLTISSSYLETSTTLRLGKEEDLLPAQMVATIQVNSNCTCHNY